MALCPRVESSQFALEMQGISKSFGPIKALEDVTLRVQQGTVHALVGENGAGKSTLMKILAGVHQPDTGTIVRNGKTCAWKHPSDSLAAGVAMIYQELASPRISPSPRTCGSGSSPAARCRYPTVKVECSQTP